MNVKELKEKIANLPDNMLVFVAEGKSEFTYKPVNGAIVNKINFTENPNGEVLGADNVLVLCKIVNRISKTIEEREADFRREIQSIEGFSDELKLAFCDHWTEPNRSKTKMLFERKPTWDSKRRLKAWYNNNKNWYGKVNNGNNQRQVPRSGERSFGEL